MNSDDCGIASKWGETFKMNNYECRSNVINWRGINVDDSFKRKEYEII